jgi:hypothetical protein
MIKSLALCSFVFGSLALFSQDLSELYVKNIDTVDLFNNLNYLAANKLKGRKTGEKGQKQAADYIQAQFKKAGVLPFPEKEYFQKFNLLLKNKSGSMIAGNKEYHFPQDFGFKSLYQTLDFDVKSAVYIMGEDLMATKTNYNNEFVLIEIDNIQTFDFDLVENIKSEGILFLVNNYRAENYKTLQKDYLAMIQKVVKIPMVFLNRKSLPSVFIQSLVLNQSNKCTFSFKLNSIQNYKSTENVIGFIEGSDSILKKEVIVISAHYDHLGVKKGKVFNGADDNGSGTTALLEIAQAFQQAKNDGTNPKRSILFIALTGEEMGLFGSSYYVENPWIPLENTIADINIDMIGRASKPKEKDTFAVYVIGSNMLSNDLHNTQELANKQFTKLNLDYKYNDVNEPLRLYYRSDHFNFAKNGIPSVFYFGGFHDDYHKTTDDIESINFKKIEMISKMVFHTSWILGNAEKRPAMN